MANKNKERFDPGRSILHVNKRTPCKKVNNSKQVIDFFAGSIPKP